MEQGNPFFYRLHPGRYAVARAGLGSSPTPLWKIETKDSTFVQVKERVELYGSHLENSSMKDKEEGKSIPSPFSLSMRSIGSCVSIRVIAVSS